MAYDQCITKTITVAIVAANLVSIISQYCVIFFSFDCEFIHSDRTPCITYVYLIPYLVVPALCIIAIVLRIFSWIISAIFQCATLVIYVLCIVFHCLVFVQRVEKQKLSNEVYSAPLIALGAGLALQLLMLVETVARSRLESKYGHQKFIDESERNYRLHMKLYGLEEKDADI